MRIPYGNHKLASSDCEDIGIDLVEHLNFDKHINYIIDNAITRKTFEFIEIQILNVYTKKLSDASCNMPHLSGTHLWLGKLRPLKTCKYGQQNGPRNLPPNICRWIDQIGYPPPPPPLSYCRVRYGDMIQMYKLICKPKAGAYDCSLPSLVKKFPRDMRGHDKK